MTETMTREKETPSSHDVISEVVTDRRHGGAHRVLSGVGQRRAEEGAAVVTTPTPTTRSCNNMCSF